jgi:hypothetical protein
LRQHQQMHLNAALLIHAVFGRCSIKTELLQTTLSAKHLSAVVVLGQDKPLFNKLHLIQ